MDSDHGDSMKPVRLVLVTAALFLALALSRGAAAVEIEEVVSTSPAWNTFTNEDGTGLYHEILREVFGLYGIEVRHIYSLSGRSEELVLQKQADIMTCDDKAGQGLVLGRYPMYSNDFHVFFKKDRIGPWKGVESLRGKELLAQPTYYDQSNFPVPVRIKELPTAGQCLGMILLNRSDFYVDDRVLIEKTLEETSIEFSPADFAIEKAGSRSYFPLFNTTERGRAIREMYEDGMLRLHRDGRLRPLFEKWGYDYPDFDNF